jgi:hypothetical protein
MPAFKRVSINGPQFFELIVKPSFGDLVPGLGVRNGYFGEFIVMTDVAHERKIIDIRRLKNILRRRDASCHTEYTPIAKAGLRKIIVTELGGGMKMCKEEFYQGCLKDWKKGDPAFVDGIVDYFRNGIATDMMTLMYFGDVELPEDSDPNNFNVNQFDGIFTQYKKYVAANVIKSGQTFNVPNAVISASNAKSYLENLYSKQDSLMSVMLDTDKAFYIDKAWADAYEDYLIASGQGSSESANFTQNGIKVRAYKNIPIFVNPFFNPVLTQIIGANSHFGVLTLRGNFVFATDDSYGDGPNDDEALVVWYNYDEGQWKWRTALKGGTQIALPEHSVLALPS